MEKHGRAGKGDFQRATASSPTPGLLVLLGNSLWDTAIDFSIHRAKGTARFVHLCTRAPSRLKLYFRLPYLPACAPQAHPDFRCEKDSHSRRGQPTKVGFVNHSTNGGSSCYFLWLKEVWTFSGRTITNFRTINLCVARQLLEMTSSREVLSNWYHSSKE